MDTQVRRGRKGRPLLLMTFTAQMRFNPASLNAACSWHITNPNHSRVTGCPIKIQISDSEVMLQVQMPTATHTLFHIHIYVCKNIYSHYIRVTFELYIYFYSMLQQINIKILLLQSSWLRQNHTLCTQSFKSQFYITLHLQNKLD